MSRKTHYVFAVNPPLFRFRDKRVCKFINVSFAGQSYRYRWSRRRAAVTPTPPLFFIPHTHKIKLRHTAKIESLPATYRLVLRDLECRVCVGSVRVSTEVRFIPQTRIFALLRTTFYILQTLLRKASRPFIFDLLDFVLGKVQLNYKVRRPPLLFPPFCNGNPCMSYRQHHH